jgi:hypothetical protein
MKEKPNGRKDTLKEKDHLGDQGKMGGLGVCELELVG